MNKIVRLYRQNHSSFRFKIVLFITKFLSLFIFEPHTYFKVPSMSQGGSYIRTLKILRRHYEQGIGRYFNQFRAKKC